jgi:hypothetical protein
MLRRKDGAVWSLAMKKLVIAIVLATLMASPAFAKKRHAISPEAAAAQAYAPSDAGLSTVDSTTVVVNGQIVGRDPDPNVRLMLIRDPKADAS